MSDYSNTHKLCSDVSSPISVGTTPVSWFSSKFLSTFAESINYTYDSRARARAMQVGHGCKFAAGGGHPDSHTHSNVRAVSLPISDGNDPVSGFPYRLLWCEIQYIRRMTGHPSTQTGSATHRFVTAVSFPIWLGN